MIKQKFKIEWKDPETGEHRSEVKEFTGDREFPPHEWAEDYAYSVADKGWHKVTEVK